MQNNPVTPDENPNDQTGPENSPSVDNLASAEPHVSSQPSFENYRDFDAELSGVEDVSPVPSAATVPSSSQVYEPPKVQQVANAAKPPKRPRKPLLIGLIIAGVLALLGGGVALGYNLWYQNPDKVVTDAFSNLTSGQPIALSGHLTDNSKDSQAKLTFNGQLDSKVGKLSAGLESSQGGVKYSVDGEAIIDSRDESKQAMYLKLNKVGELFKSFSAGADAEDALFMSVYGDLIDSVDGQWIRFDFESKDSSDDELMGDQRCLSDKFAKLIKKDSVKFELTDLYRQNKFIVIKEKLGSKSVNGIGSLGYRIGFDIKSLKSFTDKLNDTELVRELKKCDDDISFDSKSITSTQDDVDRYNIEVYVGRFGHQLTQLKLALQEDGVSNELVVSFDYSKDVTVSIPEDSRTLEEVLEDFQRSFMQPTVDCVSGVDGCAPAGPYTDA